MTPIIAFVVIFGLGYILDCISHRKTKRQNIRCANGAHKYSGWRHVETTHYGDKDIYQRKCHHCGIVDTTVSRLEP